MDYPNKNCGQCERLFEEDNVEPQCEQCERPELLPENHLAWRIANRAIRINRNPKIETRDGGIRTSNDLLPEINHEAIRFLFDLYKVPKNEKESLYDKILLYERVIRDYYRAE